MKTLQNLAVGLILLVAVLLFTGVGVLGPQWVTDNIILKIVTLPEDVPEPVFSKTPVSQEMADSLITGAGIRKHVSRLASLPSRVAGYPGNRIAMEYVRDQFAAVGLDDVTVEPFKVMSPVDNGFTLVIQSADTTTIKVYQLWPNLIRLNSFPDGISGPFLYGGKGEFSALNGKQVDGSVVLMDFDCQDQYLNARMLGAQAIIFYDSGPSTVMQYQSIHKHLDVPANVPRFWVEDNQAQMLLEKAKSGEATVTLRGTMGWENTETWNVLARLDGSDELKPDGEAGERWKDNIVVLSSFYDAMSVVPAIAPGAESAAGISALLEIAKAMKIVKPKYTILFLATSAHFNGLQGINEFLDAHNRVEKVFLDRIPEEDRIPFKLFLGIDLSSQVNQVGLFSYGSLGEFGPSLKNLFAPHAKRFINYAQAAGLNGEGVESKAKYLNSLLPSTRSQFSYMPGGPAYDSELVLLSGLHGLTFATPNDNRVRVDTPVDRIEMVNFENLTVQSRTITRLLGAMLSDPNAFTYDESIRHVDEGRDLKGKVVEFDRTVDFFTPKKPISNALVVYQAGYQSHAGVRGFMITQADAAGQFEMSMIREHRAPLTLKLRSYGVDVTGNIIYAPDLGEEGDKMFPLEVPVSAKINETTQVLFPCKTLNLFDIVDPGVFTGLDNLTVLGRDNSVLRKYGAAYEEKQSLFSKWMTNAAVVFTKPEDRPKMFMTTGPLGLKYLLTNTAESWLDETDRPITSERLEEARGRGFSIATDLIPYPFYQSARDLWVLNGARLDNLEAHGVTNARASTLHEMATKALLEARTALAELRYDAFVSQAREAWGFEARAYPDVRYAADDTVDGIVFYFMLLLPFCFFIERLFFGYPDIRKQLLTVGVIFVGVFLLLQQVHPAFQLSLTPYMVFLAFVILALGIIIILLLVAKFDSAMKSATRLSTGLHEADIGRLSATAVAISLGISNLRKRRLRTALTAVTLTLLTFTVLSFTSFKTGIQFYTIDRPNKPPYQGALMRSLTWRSLSPAYLPYIENAFANKAEVVPRSWYQPEDLESPYIDLLIPDKDVNSTVQIILGLHTDEPLVSRLDDYLLPGGRWFEPDERQACLVPSELAQRLKITSGDVGTTILEILGTAYTVIGIIDSERLDAYRDLDDESILPTSFAMTQQMANSMEDEMFMSTMKSTEHILSRNVLILPYQQTIDLNGSARSIAITEFENIEVFEQNIESFMSRVVLAMFVGMGDKVKVYRSLGTTSVSGISNLIIPILIAAMLVLNTMMGAVFERFREIGVYSAVGLAPNHVAALFIAEAAVFATVGAVMGYLLGQILTMVLSSYDLLGGLSLNYSSVSAVYSTLVVMAVVFLSTIYPAKKAADMTVEDVTRRWEPPQPDGDEWSFDFPFTVNTQETLPLSSYLAHIFRTHEDSSSEDFVTDNTTLKPVSAEDPNTYSVSGTVWLAPYDLAISQDVILALENAEEEDLKLYKIIITIRRRSGDWAQWQTINRRFFGVLRKRFLVWRTLPHQIKETYRGTGHEEIESLAKV
ncbi:MAG: FtsX-like permease family protein [Gemmatimonadota bacterium]|nr:FtsX-like permease family protein [Gemmatimonadota bacterium]